MVSALSSRLLSSKQSRSINESIKANKDSLSRKNADEEEWHTLPPVLIDLDRKHKSLGLSSRRKLADTMENKRKLSERNYAAATVKADLAKAGRSYPLLVTKRSRIIPNLDMSGVKVVSSKSLESSPFLSSAAAAGLHESRYDTLMNSYKDFLSETACLYSKEYETSEGDSEENETSEGVSTEVEASIISSITDNESDDSGKYDDTIKSKEGSSPKAPNYTSTSIVSMMEEVISVSKPSRLIAVAAAPHEVVFANAAYASLTGLSLLETLGKPLFQLISPMHHQQQQQWGVTSSLQSIVKLPKEKQDDMLFCLYRLGKLQSNRKYRTSITPIIASSSSSSSSSCADRNNKTPCSSTAKGNDYNNIPTTKKVTHYAIDFTLEETNPLDNDAVATEDRNETNHKTTTEETQLKQQNPFSVIG